jgi:murein L,D-transpeptidase YafK
MRHAFAFTLASLLAATLLLSLGCTSQPAPVVPLGCAFSVADKPVPLGKVDTNKTRIVIEKSAYTLKLYEGDRLLRCYPVVLGPDPVHDKMREGDGCTPEGKFHVRTKYDHAKWSKFIWVDYPTAESWERFHRRLKAGEIAVDATIGGEIGIHGTPESREDLISNKQNWTLGCISLTRAHVEELYACIRTGTEIQILH